VVLDAHDEGYQEERAPTWSAWRVALERAERAGAPCALVSPCPSLELLAAAPLVRPARSTERAGWPAVVVLDRRGDDPRTGLYSSRLVSLVREGGRVVCVLNRKGRARLLVCGSCREVSRCERCGGPVEQAGDGLRCRVCGAERPFLCQRCGAGRLRALRVGVARAREELEALAGVPVGEVTSETDEVPDAAVLVGTEAVLRRSGPVDAVAFLDFDQELLAARFRAGEQARALLARAARLVGGRPKAGGSGGRVLVQTRLPDHEVLGAAVHADPGRLATADGPRRRELRLPPAAALAVVSGPQAPGYVEQLPSSIEVLSLDGGRWMVRAGDHGTLCDALASVPRPAGRMRVEVDPLRV
jgi:primosomal protein N' (replication factor Y)